MSDWSKTPIRRPREGQMTWDSFGPWFETVVRDILARGDIRNPQSDVAAGILAEGATVTLGDGARASSARLLPQVASANRASVQSANAILTATSDATSSTIAIAAHSVKYDFDTIAYGSGTVSGLTPETTYLVYCDDPDYEGGTVTYYATTNPDNLIASGRYYLGYVVTPVTGSSELISGVVAGNPTRFNCSTIHGWATGNVVDFTGFIDANWTNFNTGTYTITVVDSDTFSVAVDSTAYGAYTGFTATATRVTSSTVSGGGAGAGSGGGGDTGTRWDGIAAL